MVGQGKCIPLLHVVISGIALKSGLLNIKKSLWFTWEHSMAPKYDLYSDSMESSSSVQFNIVLDILNAGGGF